MADYRADVAGSTGKDGAFQLRLLEHLQQTFQFAYGMFGRMGVGRLGGGQQVDVAEAVIGCVQAIRAVKQRLHLSAHLVVIDGRGEYHHVDILDLLDCLLCLVVVHDA